MTNTYLVIITFCFRYVQIGVASFGSIVDCGSKPGGFSRLTFDVMQWIRKVKVNKKVFSKREKYSFNIKVDSWQHRIEMEQQKIRLELQKGVWCGYQNEWNTANAKISYDKIMLSSTNMQNPGIGLNTQSGVCI